MKRTRKHLNDPAQTKFVGIIWKPFQHPFRLHTGDVIRLGGRLCRVIRVNETPNRSKLRGICPATGTTSVVDTSPFLLGCLVAECSA